MAGVIDATVSQLGKFRDAVEKLELEKVAKDAGIVTATKEWNGKFTECKYTKGPNWKAYLDGNLRRNGRKYWESNK